MLICIFLIILSGILSSYFIISCIVQKFKNGYIEVTSTAVVIFVFSLYFFILFTTITIINVTKNHKIVSELYTTYVTKKELTEEEVFENEKKLIEIRLSNYWTSFYTNSQKDFLKDVTFVKSE